MREPDVVGDRAAEEVPLLRKHHDPALQRVERRVAEVDAAELDRSLLRVVLPRQQLGQRRLAGAGGPHERDVLSDSELQRDVAHDGVPVCVAEGDPLDGQHAFARELDGRGPLHDRIRHAEQPDDLAERGEPLAELPEPFAEAGDRVEELDQVDDEGGDRPLRDRPVPVHRRRDEQDGDQRRRLRERNHREQADVHERGAAPCVHLRVAAGTVGIERLPLAPERLHHADARKPLLQHRQRLGDTVPDRVVDVAGAVVEGPAGEEQDRQRDERDEGERRRQDDERRYRQDDLEPAADDLDQRLADELRQRLHVGCQARDEHARALALEEAERQRLQLLERRRPQVAEKPLPRRRREERLRPHDERLHEREADQYDRRDVQRPLLVLRDPGIDRVAHQRRPGEGDQRRRDHGRGRAHVPAPDRPQQAARLVPNHPRRNSLVHAARLSIASRAR